MMFWYICLKFTQNSIHISEAAEQTETLKIYKLSIQLAKWIKDSSVTFHSISQKLQKKCVSGQS